MGLWVTGHPTAMALLKRIMVSTYVTIIIVNLKCLSCLLPFSFDKTKTCIYCRSGNFRLLILGLFMKFRIREF